MWKAQDDIQKAQDYYNEALKLYEDMGMKLWVGKAQKKLHELE